MPHNSQEVLEIYKRRIYLYCDEHIGYEVLFTSFTHLWPVPQKGEETNSNYNITPQDLTRLTSEIIIDLQHRGIVKEVEKPGEIFETFYPMYQITEHKRLIVKKEKWKSSKLIISSSQ